MVSPKEAFSIFTDWAEERRDSFAENHKRKPLAYFAFSALTDWALDRRQSHYEIEEHVARKKEGEENLKRQKKDTLFLRKNGVINAFKNQAAFLGEDAEVIIPELDPKKRITPLELSWGYKKRKGVYGDDMWEARKIDCWVLREHDTEKIGSLLFFSDYSSSVSVELKIVDLNAEKIKDLLSSLSKTAQYIASKPPRCPLIAQGINAKMRGAL